MVEITLISSIAGFRAQAREIDGKYRGPQVVLARGSRADCEAAIRVVMARNPDAIRTGDRTEGGGHHSGPDADDAGGLIGFGAED